MALARALHGHTCMTPRCALIVDGVPVMARMLAEGLDEAGWDSQLAGRFGEALAAIGSGHFSAVVSEVDIPDGDGFELLARVRGGPGPAPAVILTSAYASPSIARRAGEAGAFAYLPKPFELEALVALLESAHAKLEGA